MHRKRLTTVATLALITLLGACSGSPGLRCQPGESLQFHDLLYFGTSRDTRPAVTEAEWDTFLTQVLTAHFPEGLTILTGTGQWRSGSGEVVREGSHVLSLVHPGNGASEASIKAVIRSYKSRFEQESVLRVRSSACVAFH